MMNEKAILSVVPVAGVPVFKCLTNSGRKGWGQNVVYTFEDGTTHKGTITGGTRRDLLLQAAIDDAKAKDGSLRATFNNGEFWGTVRRFSVSGLIANQATL